MLTHNRFKAINYIIKLAAFYIIALIWCIPATLYALYYRFEKLDPFLSWIFNQTINPNQYYYVISLKWSVGGYYTFWRAQDKGYTGDLKEAGKYTKSEIDKYPHYYNNGEDTIAVPCQELKRHFSIVQKVLANSGELDRYKL